jgi:hypothetical protein
MCRFMIIFFCFLASILSGCSVFMAAQQKGVDVKTISSCKTRSCLISHGATPIQVTKYKNGITATETFQAEAPTGSAARAAMHGVLDVATLGLWEVAGTPIEGVKNKKEIYAVKAVYASDGETIKALQLVN